MTMSEQELRELGAKFQAGLATQVDLDRLHDFMRRGLGSYRHGTINAFLNERWNVIEAQGNVAAFFPSPRQCSN
jgi:hypothetical protein